MAVSLIKYAFSIGVLNEQQLTKAEQYKTETGSNDETVIRDMKLLSDEKLLKVYGSLYGYHTEYEVENKDTELAQQFKLRDLKTNSFYPVQTGSRITLYTSQPSQLLYIEDAVRDKTGYKGGFDYVITTDNSVSKLIEYAFKDNDEGVNDADFDISGEGLTNNVIYDVSENDSSGVVNWVNKIFRDAVENRISDVHFEPQEDGFYIRFRSDGSLKIEHKLPLNSARQIINRIKTMSNLDVNTSKAIQDGNCRLDLFGKVVDLRVSVIPAVNGENLVVRVLDQNKMSLDVSMIGFSKENEKKFLKIIQKPKGIILLTGPTGSGKSTSLYAALSALNTSDRCIITFEDPIEYRIPGIVQVQINQAMGVTFPQALKSGLRQDIEVALVGEIRDMETASIAFDAANTGHMVFSTLHTNSAASSILRLVKMGVEPYMISSTLIAVINQRLAKRICPYCKEEYHLEKDSPYRKVLKCGDKDVRLYRGRGCSKCGGDGYKGRVAIQEFLILNEELGEILDKGGTTFEIEQAAVKNGMKKIQQDGIEKALAGITTLDEVHRTVFFDEL